jgi:hypothetical protein
MPTKNPEIMKAKKARWYVKNKARILLANATTKAPQIRSAHLQRKFGMSLEVWEKYFNEQGRRCASCGSLNPGGVYGWHTDHDHCTGTFRAILCRPCNIALGLVEDNIDHLKCLAQYLERFHA